MEPVSVRQSRPGQAVDKMKCLNVACRGKQTDSFPSSSNGVNNTDLHERKMGKWEEGGDVKGRHRGREPGRLERRA